VTPIRYGCDRSNEDVTLTAAAEDGNASERTPISGLMYHGRPTQKKNAAFVLRSVCSTFFSKSATGYVEDPRLRECGRKEAHADHDTGDEQRVIRNGR